MFLFSRSYHKHLSYLEFRKYLKTTLKIKKTFKQQREITCHLICTPNEDSDQPARMRRLIWAFVVRMEKFCMPGYPKCTQWRFWSDCANAQAELNVRWTHISDGKLSFNVMAHFIILFQKIWLDFHLKTFVYWKIASNVENQRKLVIHALESTKAAQLDLYLNVNAKFPNYPDLITYK